MKLLRTTNVPDAPQPFRMTGETTNLTGFKQADNLPPKLRRSGRAAECAGLENRWARKGPVSSNLTSSAFRTGSDTAR
jgi:hypothetical protein